MRESESRVYCFTRPTTPTTVIQGESVSLIPPMCKRLPIGVLVWPELLRHVVVDNRHAGLVGDIIDR